VRSIAVLLVAFWAAAAAAQDESALLPCGGAALATPAGGAIRVWNGSTAEAESWHPPACTGWTAPGFKLLVQVAGSFPYEGDGAGLLDRFGAVSALTQVRFWSVSESDWRPLVERSLALAGPGAERRRPDFTADELKRGGDFYFEQGGGRASDVTYRLRVLDATHDRIVLSTENVTAVKLFLVTLFPPGELQSVYVLQRRATREWSYVNLTRTGREASPLTDGRDASIVNRAAALARHFTGTELVRGPAPSVSRR
jgi:hypothetical protein